MKSFLIIHSKLFSLIGVLLIALALPITMFLLRQNQDIRQHAQETTVDINLADTISIQGRHVDELGRDVTHTGLEVHLYRMTGETTSELIATSSSSPTWSFPNLKRANYSVTTSLPGPQSYDIASSVCQDCTTHTTYIPGGPGILNFIDYPQSHVIDVSFRYTKNTTPLLPITAKITSPTGGESFTAGSQQTVTWTVTENSLTTISYPLQTNIFLYKTSAGATAMVHKISPDNLQSIKGQNRYTWPIQETPGTSYILGISIGNPQTSQYVYDALTTPFSINASSFSSDDYTVKLIYFYPKDFTPDPRLISVITPFVTDVQKWYLDKLGRTFALSQITLMRGQKTTAEYNTSDAFWPIASELGLVKGQNTNYLIYIPAAINANCCSWTFEAPAYSGETNNGFAIIRDDVFDADVVGPRGMCRDGKKYMSDYSCNPQARRGGTAHELGHMFTLPHPLDCESTYPSYCNDTPMYAWWNWPNVDFLTTTVAPEKQTLLSSAWMTQTTTTPVQPTIIPLPTSTVTPTQPPTTPQTIVSLSVKLHGIGTGGDNLSTTGGNTNPLHQTRELTLDIINAAGEIVRKETGTMTYRPQFGDFEAEISIQPVPVGQSYRFRISSPGFISSLSNSLIPIAPIGINRLAPTTLTNGDAYPDNHVDILDYSAIMSCWIGTTPCSEAEKRKTDLNDDGSVDVLDYNLFIREMSVQGGN